jgi:hypothetical protein
MGNADTRFIGIKEAFATQFNGCKQFALKNESCFYIKTASRIKINLIKELSRAPAYPSLCIRYTNHIIV